MFGCLLFLLLPVVCLIALNLWERNPSVKFAPFLRGNSFISRILVNAKGRKITGVVTVLVNVGCVEGACIEGNL